MKHLVIGSGRMGKRHGKILQDLGDCVDYCDIEFKPGQHVRQYDSLLVCTPGETHAGLIKDLTLYNKPLFVEKPVFTKYEELPTPKDRQGLDWSMVACNWRWCEHLDLGSPEFGTLNCQYKNANMLDLIHFVDLRWQLSGKPSSWFLIQNESGITGISMSGGSGGTHGFILRDSQHQLTVWRDKKIHQYQCNMFVDQMKAWREVASEKLLSPNPIHIAVERTKWLLDCLNKNTADLV